VEVSQCARQKASQKTGSFSSHCFLATWDYTITPRFPQGNRAKIRNEIVRWQLDSVLENGWASHAEGWCRCERPKARHFSFNIITVLNCIQDIYYGVEKNIV
jgi:hypothetical protein